MSHDDRKESSSEAPRTSSEKANREHHEGLADRGLRDLVADQLRFDKHGTGMGFHCTGNPERLRASLEASARKAQETLDGFDAGRGLRKVVDLLGWDVHDVSDHVAYDSKAYRDFVGNREELMQRYPNAEPDGRGCVV